MCQMAKTMTNPFFWTLRTFQLSFIIAIVIGLGVGEALFGRYSLQFSPSH
jgi:hypothetical protein